MALHALPIEAEIEVMVENSIWSITGRVWVWDESVQIAVEEAIADIEAIASHITTTFPEWDYKMSYSCNKI